MTSIFTSKRNCFALLFAVGAMTTTNAQNYSVSLNSSSQYIDAGNNALFDATNIKTLECWVKFNSLTGNQEILSRSTFYSGIEILLLNGDLNFFCMQTQPVSSFISYPVSNLQLDTWYHIAATYEGTKESMRLYVNGVSVGTRTDFGDINGGGITNPAGTFMIGQWSDAFEDRYLNGTVDEVRVWSVARTPAEIKAGMYGTVATNTSGLLAYYMANEGSGTTLINSSTANVGLNGTLINGASWAASPIQAAGNSLNFDGIDDQVIFPASPAYEITTGTIECWLQPANLNGANEACFLSNRSDDLTRYSFHITDAHVGFDNGTTYMTLPHTFNNGTWYHIAFVAGATSVEAFVDGVSIGTYPEPFSNETGRPLVLGLAKNLGSDGEPYTGNIDEVRIWNVQRTATDILATKNTTLTGSEAGLTTLYSFNQGIANGDNTALLIPIDNTVNNNHGMLVNFAVNGTTSNWVAQSVSLPVKYTYFTASKENDIAILRWETAQEQNSRSFTIERSTDGSSFSTIGALPAAGNSNINIAYSFTDHAPEPGDNYYRLLQTDLDGRVEYSKILSLRFPLVTQLKVAPNPVKGTLFYSVTGLKQTRASFIITDMNGRNVLVKNITIQVGVNKFSEVVGNLPAGNYTLQISNITQGLQLSQRLLIAK